MEKQREFNFLKIDISNFKFFLECCNFIKRSSSGYKLFTERVQTVLGTIVKQRQTFNFRRLFCTAREIKNVCSHFTKFFLLKANNRLAFENNVVFLNIG